MRTIDLVGKRYGDLVVVERARAPVKRAIFWLCRCDCGGTSVVQGANLRSGHTRSCGCRRTSHHDTTSAEYRVWHGMRQRCSNPKGDFFHRYGGRGIAVCARWRGSFEAFLEDMGRRPSARHSIDRIDNDRGYSCGKCDDCAARVEPANCRWATQTEQRRNACINVLVEIDGETLCATAWAERIGVSRHVLFWRLRHGWTGTRLLSPPRPKRPNGAGPRRAAA